MPPVLSIVIVNYNTRDFLRGCLSSIAAHSGELEVEVIVVDNASKDGSAAMLRAEFPLVRLVEPGVNTWFTGGNNLGVRQAEGEYILLLNSDTLVIPKGAPRPQGLVFLSEVAACSSDKTPMGSHLVRDG